MSTEVIEVAIGGFFATSITSLLVLLIRIPWLRFFGAHSLPLLWGLVPSALIATALPAPSLPVGAFDIPKQSVAIGTLISSYQQVGHPSSAPFYLLVACWIFGSGFMSLRLIRLQSRFRSALGDLKPYAEDIDIASGTLEGPVVLGLIHPRIILPADFDVRYTRVVLVLILIQVTPPFGWTPLSQYKRLAIAAL